MAAAERKDGPGFPVAIVATVLVALAGLIVGGWQLVATRPPASEGGSPPLAGQIETMIKEIQSLRQGAFAPFTEQPVVRAMLLPISSVGGMSLLLHYLGWGQW